MATSERALDQEQERLQLLRRSELRLTEADYQSRSEPDDVDLLVESFLHLRGNAGNRFQTSFYHFLTEWVHTKDEAGGGDALPFPDYPFVQDLCDDLIEHQLLFIEKSRRVVASWLVCAFDLWLACGGYDPRWPTIAKPHGERQIVISALKHEEVQGSCWFLESRIKFIYDSLVKRGIRDVWPDFPKAVFEKTNARFANGGRIDAVASGPSKVIGAGITFAHFEEVHEWPYAEKAIAKAVPTLLGRRDVNDPPEVRRRGHLCCISTANSDSWAAALVLDRLKPSQFIPEAMNRENPMSATAFTLEKKPRRRILPKRWVQRGFHVVTVHYSLVPNYDLEAASMGLSDAERRMELEIDWTATTGVVIYPQYSDRIHLAEEPLDFDPKLPLHLGWDVPGCPCCSFVQINQWGQACVFPPVAASEDDPVGVYEFGERVANHLNAEYAQPNDIRLEDLLLVHKGDPAGNQKPSRTRLKKSETRAAFDVLHRGSRLYMGEDEYDNPLYEDRPGWGWRIINGPMEITDRLEIVRHRLKSILPNGLPALQLDPRAQETRRAFLGGYHRHKFADGTIGKQPEKNWFSHCMDSLAYALSRLDAQPIPTGLRSGEEEDSAPAFVSRANSRYGRY